MRWSSKDEVSAARALVDEIKRERVTPDATASIDHLQRLTAAQENLADVLSGTRIEVPGR